MRMKIEMTDRIQNTPQGPAYVWTGTTENGVPCWVLVFKVAVADEHRDAFKREVERGTGPKVWLPEH